MQNKKIVILIALGIVAFISLIYGASVKPKWQTDAASQGVVIKNGSEPVCPGNAIGQTRRRAKRTQYRLWKRSIFVPKGMPGTAMSKLSLNGIIASGKEFKAMIGDSIVGKGDKISGNTVVDVKKDKVILNDGTKDFELKIEQ